MSDSGGTDDVVRVSRIEAGQIDLVDESGNTRATLACSSAENRGHVVLHLYDQTGAPRLSLQVDDKEGPSISLWNTTSSPCISLGVLTGGNGITICDREGKPLIVAGVPAERGEPEVTVSDSSGAIIVQIP